MAEVEKAPTKRAPPYMPYASTFLPPIHIGVTLPLEVWVALSPKERIPLGGPALCLAGMRDSAW